MAIANIRVNYSVPFPATVQGVGGIKVVKADGIYTISPDFPALAVSTPDISQWANTTLWLYNSVTGAYSLVTLATLFSIATAGSATIRVITAAGTITILATDTVIAVNKSSASATPFLLPAVAARSPLGLPLEVYDFAGTGGDMTFTPNGTEKIMGLNGPWTVGSGGVAQSGGRIRLIPSVSLNGWMVS